MGPYSKDESGKYRANPGNYHLDWAYGGVKLVKMCNEGGGIQCITTSGYTTKSALYNEMQAFIAGLNEWKGA